MKKLLNILLGCFLALSTLFSCAKESNDELAGHLLIGPYGVLAQGGAILDAKLKANIPSEDNQEAWEKAYLKTFAFPHSPAHAAELRTVLQGEHQVMDKASAQARVKTLIEKGNSAQKYHAFDYAVAANVISMAHAVGYFTDAEALAENQKVLQAARGKYDDWETYLNDVLEGRKQENKPAQELFDAATAWMLTVENSPYKKLKL